MTNRKIRLIIERNKSRFSDNCSILVDSHVTFMGKRVNNILSVEIAKWMKDMLGDHDYKLVRSKLEDMAKQIGEGKDGMEILIKI